MAETSIEWAEDRRQLVNSLILIATEMPDNHAATYSQDEYQAAALRMRTRAKEALDGRTWDQFPNAPIKENTHG